MGNGWPLGGWVRTKQKKLGDEIGDGIQGRGVNSGACVQTRGRCRTGCRLSVECKLNLTIHVHTLSMILTKIVSNKIGPATLGGRAASPPLRGYFFLLAFSFPRGRLRIQSCSSCFCLRRLSPQMKRVQDRNLLTTFTYVGINYFTLMQELCILGRSSSPSKKMRVFAEKTKKS